MSRRLTRFGRCGIALARSTLSGTPIRMVRRSPKRTKAGRELGCEVMLWNALRERLGAGMKSASEVALHLLTSCPSLEHFAAYMFGSAVAGVGADIDILIVGPGGSLLSAGKRTELRSAGEALPLHLLCMLPSEALHTQFVAKEKVRAALSACAGEPLNTVKSSKQ